nr:GntR family transcriptional regulator [Jiella flava]
MQRSIISAKIGPGRERGVQPKRQQKSNQIYHMLRRSIILLEMQPGSLLIEKDLAAQWGVSRTPVREAIQKLADEGLVTVFPHSATIVSKISYRMAEEGFIIRRALEVESVRRAAERATPEIHARLATIVTKMRAIVSEQRLGEYIEVDNALHCAIAEASGVGRLWRFVMMAKVDLDRMRQLSAPVPGHLDRVTDQHAQIVDAICHGRPDLAELTMRVHLESSFEVMSRLIAEDRDIFEPDGPRPVQKEPAE